MWDEDGSALGTRLEARWRWGWKGTVTGVGSTVGTRIEVTRNEVGFANVCTKSAMLLSCGEKTDPENTSVVLTVVHVCVSGLFPLVQSEPDSTELRYNEEI